MEYLQVMYTQKVTLSSALALILRSLEPASTIKPGLKLDVVKFS